MTENNPPQWGANPGSAPGPEQPAGHAPYGHSSAFGHPTQPQQPEQPQSQRPIPQPQPQVQPLAQQAQQLQQPRQPRQKRTWPAIVGTAAVTAMLVGGGTAAGTVAFMNRDSAQPVAVQNTGAGPNQNISVTSVDEANWETTASTVAPSVVAIEVKTSRGGGEGSGVVIDLDGHVLTNDHVVTGALGDTVQVTLSDGRLYDATIVGLDPSTDLGVVKIVDPPADLAPAIFANSDDVIVGNAVMAVGNPLGLANTVTTGIVSAVARPVSTASQQIDQGVVVTNAIQIDAAINPGNSGGPLFNTKGEVIGITSSIASLSGGGTAAGSIGLGFAIPSNLASAVGDQLMADGTAEHAFLGVGLSDSTATADGVKRRGAKVESVTDGSPAAAAGIKTGDVIIAFDGHQTGGYESLTAHVRERTSGQNATVTLVRGSTAQDVEVTLAAKESKSGAPDTSGKPAKPQPGDSDPGTPPDDLSDWFSEQRD